MSFDTNPDPALQSRQQSAGVPPVTRPQEPTLGDSSTDGSSGEGEVRESQIERVIDVPLAVTLRFGQRHLTLREVLALTTGSLVELDRQVEEPVDLVLGDRLIAKGEVVIVDGNYGLRITEVVEGVAHRIPKVHGHVPADPPLSEAQQP